MITDFDMVQFLAKAVTAIQTDSRYKELFKLHKYRCHCSICEELNIPEHNFCICDACKLQIMDASAELAGAVKLAEQITPGFISRQSKLKIDLFQEGQ